MTVEEWTEMLHHMEWADGRVWAAIVEMGAPGDDAVRELAHHVHAVQHAYADLLRGRAPDVPDLSDDDTLESIMAWGRAAHGELRRCAGDLDDPAMERVLEVPWAHYLVGEGVEPIQATVAQSLLQVAMHSTYHRGQINRRIREAGGEPPLVDFVAWIWQGKPDAEWPLTTTAPGTPEAPPGS